MQEKLGALKSRELVLGFSGPIGSGLKAIVELVATQLIESGYIVVRIKISDLIRRYSSILSNPASEADFSGSVGKDRYVQLQGLGNRLREERGTDFLAQLAIRQISLDRTERHPDEEVGGVVPGRVVYLVDQLKHPSEVTLLRTVYGSNFFLVGVLCGYSQRKHNLKAEGISPADAEFLMERDRTQDEKYGQKLEKTLQFADFFIRNARSNTQQLIEPIKRFLHLMHGKVSITPTRQEQGMYAAYSAALGSACLSRQVGAAIQDRQGKLVATGCNDVPRGGGGLYREADSMNDNRCVHLQGGICFNHLEKDKLRAEIQNIAKSSLIENLERYEIESERLAAAGMLAEKLAQTLREESRLKDLLEFSRSVHAEMDALVALARTGGASSQDGVLYTTTYPCHNCARHIIAAGIRAVYFIEPYEKSLAVELHSDAIDHSADEEPDLKGWDDPDRKRDRRVSFLHFEGVAPRRFSDLFAADGERKDPVTGKANQFASREASKKVPEYLEGYIDIESRVVKHLKDIGIDSQTMPSVAGPPSAA
jgi:deoxycytidylate deaminase